MEINIKADPKEIAALILAVQERHAQKKDSSVWLGENTNELEGKKL